MKKLLTSVLFAAAMLPLDAFCQDLLNPYGDEIVYVDCRKRIKSDPSKEIWEPMPSVTVDGMKDAPSKPDRTNRWGSLAGGPKFEATGFFRTEKYKGRWITVDPEGCLHIDAVVVGVRTGGGETNKASFKEKFGGDTDTWAEETCTMILSNGFNGAGNWSDCKAIRKFNETSKRQFTYCPYLNLMAGYGKMRKVTYQRPGNTGYPNQCILAFDPEFEQWCDSKVREAVAIYKDDPAVMGYFSDNEMPLSKSNLEGYLDLPEGDYGRAAAQEWLSAKGVSRDCITDEIRCEFAGYVAERYYSIVSKAIRKYDPNHMYLGSRLHGSAKKIREVYEAAARWCDVISINYYDGWRVKDTDIENWTKWADKPFIITEFYTKGEDSGLGNTSGAGWRVHTQNDRGIHYENFIIGLLRTSNCVGWHWFRYMDNDPTSKNADPSNLDANKGIVDNTYEVYKDLASHMKKVNTRRYGILMGIL